jgi:DNA-binding transcriptional LysR family regulator
LAAPDIERTKAKTWLLQFTHAAERLHIEQPPLSRAIIEPEEELGVLLFDRNGRRTVLTAAGAAFLQNVRRLFTVTLENAKTLGSGLLGSIRIAVSDRMIDSRLSASLARCRAEEPEIEIEIRLSELPLAEQLRGLRSGDFTIGFVHTADVGDGVVAEPIWQDQLVITVPARHELLAPKDVLIIN